MDALRSGTGILKIDVLGGELYIVQSGLDVSMPHEVHECRQADPGAHHIGGEGVAEAVWIGKPDTSRAAVMAEQGT
jgi:hypothetical protein